MIEIAVASDLELDPLPTLHASLIGLFGDARLHAWLSHKPPATSLEPF